MQKPLNNDHNNLRWLWLTFGIVIIDRLTKLYVTHWILLGEPGPVLPVLNVIVAHNRGTAFSFLHQAGGWQRWVLSLIAMVVSVILVVALYRLPKRDNLQASALALILGGAIGNLWDRLAQGFVTDFIDFHIGQWHFATFNLADAAITVGALLLIIVLFTQPKPPTITLG